VLPLSTLDGLIQIFMNELPLDCTVTTVPVGKITKTQEHKRTVDSLHFPVLSKIPGLRLAKDTSIRNHC
jgi:hypothetical protein